jgi:hypothetical protein
MHRGSQGVSVAVGALLLLALAGCGSSSKPATSSGAATPATGATAAKAAAYNVKLVHVAGASGAATATGVAVLSVKPSEGGLCWSISPVKTFTISNSTAMPTIITVQPTPAGTPSTPGVPLGTAYRSSGCTHVPAAFLGRLEANPRMFYLSVYNTGTGDAVRGQI